MEDIRIKMLEKNKKKVGAIADKIELLKDAEQLNVVSTGEGSELIETMNGAIKRLRQAEMD